MKDIESLSKVFGNLKTLLSPSGYTFIIREQNGEDDDILSNASGILDGTSAAKFISGLVVDTDYTKGGKLSMENAMKLKLRDKYFIIVSSRIFSMGSNLIFEYDWSDGSVPISYEEELSNFIWDYKKDFPKEGDEDYFPYRILAHPLGKEDEFEIALTSNKLLKLCCMNSYGEKYLISLKENEQSKNQELKARDISIKVKDSWVKIDSFKIFTTKEMIQIRNAVFESDPPFEMFTEIENPVNHRIELLPILGTPDFFFPREI